MRVPVPMATLTTVDGQSLSGPVAIADGAVIVSPEGGAPTSTSLKQIATLQIELPESTAEKSVDPTLLTGALPAPWRSRDLGRVVVPGKARWKDGQFILSASPKAEDERFSAMHMAYHPLEGDGEIVARVVSIENEDEDSFAGIIMCDGITPENRKAMLVVHFHGEQKVNFRRWGYQGGS